MQIRPGATLLQAIAKASETRPIPFAERLSDLQGAAVSGRVAEAAKPQISAASRETRLADKPSPAEPPVAAANPPQPAKPRGSVLNIVV